jgi:hypothetical protein
MLSIILDRSRWPITSNPTLQNKQYCTSSNLKNSQKTKTLFGSTQRAFSFSVNPKLVLIGHISIAMIMLGFFRLIASVLLMASWETTTAQETSDKYFGCQKNIDALCSHPSEDGQKQIREWTSVLLPFMFAEPRATLFLLVSDGNQI